MGMLILKTKEESERALSRAINIINDMYYLEGEDPSKPFYVDPSTFKGNMDDFRVEIPGLED